MEYGYVAVGRVGGLEVGAYVSRAGIGSVLVRRSSVSAAARDLAVVFRSETVGRFAEALCGAPLGGVSGEGGGVQRASGRVGAVLVSVTPGKRALAVVLAVGRRGFEVVSGTIRSSGSLGRWRAAEFEVGFEDGPRLGGLMVEARIRMTAAGVADRGLATVHAVSGDADLRRVLRSAVGIGRPATEAAAAGASGGRRGRRRPRPARDYPVEVEEVVAAAGGAMRVRDLHEKLGCRVEAASRAVRDLVAAGRARLEVVRAGTGRRGGPGFHVVQLVAVPAATDRARCPCGEPAVVVGSDRCAACAAGGSS